jgi:hypothetical protein
MSIFVLLCIVSYRYFHLRTANGVGFPHNCDIQKCKLAIKILTNIDNEEWREENFEQSKYFCYRCHILRITLVSDFVTLF